MIPTCSENKKNHIFLTKPQRPSQEPNNSKRTNLEKLKAYPLQTVVPTNLYKMENKIHLS